MDEKSYVLVLNQPQEEGQYLSRPLIAKMLRTYSDKQRAEEDLALVREVTAGPIAFDVIEVPHIER